MDKQTFTAEIEEIRENELSFLYQIKTTLDFENPYYEAHVTGRDQYGNSWELDFQAVIPSGEIELISDCTDSLCEPSIENIYRELWHHAVNRIAELETE